MICGLGLLLLPEGAAVHRRSLAKLARFQSPLGNIPHNVGFPNEPDAALVAEGGASPLAGSAPAAPIADTAHAGCIDNSLWFILGHYALWRATGDRATLGAAWPALERALRWLRYQDSNECGLLEVHEAVDWADLFPNRYNSLYPNVLWAAAWRALGLLTAALDRPPDAYLRAASATTWKLHQLLWVGPEVPRDRTWMERHWREWLCPTRLVDTALVVRPYFLPYMGFP